MIRELCSFFTENYERFKDYKIVLYYDNGQHHITRVLNNSLAITGLDYDFKKEVHPYSYRLFQVADFISTVRLLELKQNYKELSKSELKFIDSKHLKKNYLNVVNIYSDDGISGGTLKCPGLEEMLSDMNNKKFDTIFVINMSRFSRNYLDTGNYLDHIFPKNNIRFIATGDNYDSATYDDEESFAIKLWLNDMYLKDIGNKIRFANQKSSETKYMMAGGIYGLRKNEKGEFEINEEANVVKLIYKLRLEGLSPYKIRNYLEQKKIYSIAYNHYLKTGQRRFMGGRNPEQINKYSWNVMSIKQILISKEYNGCAVNRPYIIKNGNKYKMKILL